MMSDSRLIRRQTTQQQFPYPFVPFPFPAMMGGQLPHAPPSSHAAADTEPLTHTEHETEREKEETETEREKEEKEKEKQKQKEKAEKQKEKERKRKLQQEAKERERQEREHKKEKERARQRELQKELERELETDTEKEKQKENRMSEDFVPSSAPGAQRRPRKFGRPLAPPTEHDASRTTAPRKRPRDESSNTTGSTREVQQLTNPRFNFIHNHETGKKQRT